MRLNKHDRQAFVLAVMSDVPKIDYDAQAREIIQEDLLSAFPNEVAAAFRANPEIFPRYQTIWAPGTLSPVRAFAKNGTNYSHVEESAGFSRDAIKKVRAINRLNSAQDEELNALRRSVTTMINSVQTLKRAKEVVPPELHKYLPADRDATGVKNLPVPVVDVMTPLRKMGWPKGEK